MIQPLSFPPRGLRRFVLLASAGFGLVLALTSTPTQGADVSVPAAAPLLTDVLAHVTGGNTVGATLREPAPRPDGYYHVDTARMIKRLKQLHVNTYN